jgi:hypothetical protein
MKQPPTVRNPTTHKASAGYLKALDHRLLERAEVIDRA